MIATQRPNIASPIHQDKPHILVVDDETFNRQLLVRILSNEYDVSEAEDGQSTLDSIQQHAFDLILLDVMMPDMTGLEVLQVLHQQQNLDDLPIILISALDQNDDIVRGLQMGANDYISKPIDLDVVLARVQTQIRVKQALDMQKQAVQQLQEAEQLKNNLLRIASHDLKSPLSNVRMVETLLRQLIQNDNPAVHQILDTLNHTVDHMNHVIVEFLDMAAVQSGNIEINLQDVLLEDPINDVVGRYEVQSNEKQIEIIQAGINGSVLADNSRLEQILGNLVSNALKYSLPSTEVTIWTSINDTTTTIFIADQGPGIPINERGKLFTEFGKLSTRPTAGESSTGLGLWIVKQMAELMNGEVGVDCPADGGSIFWVKLPTA